MRMVIKTGTDITYENRFLTSLKRGKAVFLQSLFTAQEIRQNSELQLASIFCLKEAVMKALEMPHDSWLNISTDRTESGKVMCSILDRKTASTIKSLDTSISHDGGLIIAVAVALIDV